jgi:hypothetical protein
MSRCARIESLEVRTCLSISFLPAVQTPIGNTALVALGDFDGDGKADLLAKSADGPVRLFKGTGDGHFMPTPFGQLPAVQNVTDIAVGDFNHDMKLDLAMSHGPGTTTNAPPGVAVLLGNGNGTFAAPVNLFAGAGPRALAVADLNGDGKPDIVVADAERWAPPGSTIPARFAGALLLGNGDGTFQGARQVAVDGPQNSVAVRREPPAAAGPGFVAFGGLLASSASIVPRPAIFTALIAADGSSHSRTLLPFIEGVLRGVAVADFNHDGRPDLAALQLYIGPNVAINAANSRVHTYLASAEGGFTPAANVPAGVLNGVGVIAADFDHDGKPDVAVAGVVPRTTESTGPSGAVSVLPGNGQGGFGDLARFRVNGPPLAFTVGDLNNDPRPDVVTGGFGGVNALVNNSQSSAAIGSADGSDNAPIDQLIDQVTVS